MVEITKGKNMIYGLSNVEKPTVNIPDGTTLMECDTNKSYMFYNGTWFLLSGENTPPTPPPSPYIEWSFRRKYSLSERGKISSNGNRACTDYQGVGGLKLQEVYTYPLGNATSIKIEDCTGFYVAFGIYKFENGSWTRVYDSGYKETGFTKTITETGTLGLALNIKTKPEAAITDSTPLENIKIKVE